jgi:hypothetical protein
MRWWQYGVFGGVVLSLATGIKAMGAFALGATVDFRWVEAAGFVASLFGMGFLCGTIVWAGRGLYRRLGMVGDAIVGVAVMLAFFFSCMLLFAREMLGAKFWSGGVPMFGLAIVVGLIGGAWTGRDIRG